MYCIIVQHVSFVYQYSSYICFVINSLCFLLWVSGSISHKSTTQAFYVLPCKWIVSTTIHYYLCIHTILFIIYVYAMGVIWTDYLQITQCLIGLDWQVAMDCIQRNYLYTRSEKISSLKHNCHYSYLTYHFLKKVFSTKILAIWR